jgi:hypothetical protein
MIHVKAEQQLNTGHPSTPRQKRYASQIPTPGAKLRDMFFPFFGCFDTDCECDFS